MLSTTLCLKGYFDQMVLFPFNRGFSEVGFNRRCIIKPIGQKSKISD